jgi:hypothetical protein
VSYEAVGTSLRLRRKDTISRPGRMGAESS